MDSLSKQRTKISPKKRFFLSGSLGVAFGVFFYFLKLPSDFQIEHSESFNFEKKMDLSEVALTKIGFFNDYTVKSLETKKAILEKKDFFESSTIVLKIEDNQIRIQLQIQLSFFGKFKDLDLKEKNLEAKKSVLFLADHFNSSEKQ